MGMGSDPFTVARTIQGALGIFPGPIFFNFTQFLWEKLTNIIGLRVHIWGYSPHPRLGNPGSITTIQYRTSVRCCRFWRIQILVCIYQQPTVMLLGMRKVNFTPLKIIYLTYEVGKTIRTKQRIHVTSF